MGSNAIDLPRDAAGAVDEVHAETDLTAAAPPESVLDAVETAAAAYDRLEARGQHVSFELDPATGEVQIELQDLDGQPLAPLSPSEALRFADGAHQ